MLIENMFEAMMAEPEFFSKVFPYLDSDYFVEDKHKIIHRIINQHVSKHGCSPTVKDVQLRISTNRAINEELTEDCVRYLDKIKAIEDKPNRELLYDECERWAKERALENAIYDSIKILKGKEEERGTIQGIMEKALAVSFGVQLGHNYFEDAMVRHEAYNQEEEFVPVRTEAINRLLGGGYTKKAMYLWLGRTNIGKTLILCDTAADLLRAGYNVVYFTAEMSDHRIAQRVDANVLDYNVKELGDLEKKQFLNKLKNAYDKTEGQLYFKEYPTSTANSMHLKGYLDELKLKKGFIPDFIIVDYLNIFTSHRIPASRSMDSYGYIKAVTEEMRALCSMKDVGYPGQGIGLITATQTNRGGSASTADTMSYTDTSESFGAPMTVDWQGGIIQTPELFEQGKYILKNLKSRFDDNINEIVTIGVDRSRMRLYDLPDDEQEIPIHIKDQMKAQKERENQGLGAFDFELEK